jgi:hypothetical protein
MKTMRHLDDEHMRLYEWSGAGAAMPRALSAGPRRMQRWQASSAVLAVLATVLILNACDNETPLQTADEQVAQTLEQVRDELSIDMLAPEKATRPGAGLGPGLQR